jgi:hypothetical protein
MATKQTSKRAKTKAEVKGDPGATKSPVAHSVHEPRRGNQRARSRSAAARTDRSGATAAALPKSNLNGSDGVHKPEQARSYPEPIAERADAGTATVSRAEEPPASTKRAKLIGLLERPEGASVGNWAAAWLAASYRAGGHYRLAQSRSRGDAKQGCR